MDDGKLKEDLLDFNFAAKKLIQRTKNVSTLWNDSKYKALFNLTEQLAKDMRHLMYAGEDARHSIRRFAQAAEIYVREDV